MDQAISVTEFKGLRTDKGKKFIPPEYLYNVQNFNYDDIVGLNMTLAPDIFYNGGTSVSVDGIYEFKYLDSSNILQTTTICVIGGTIYKDWDTGSPISIKTGLETGKCAFTVFNDKLFIVNGKNYPVIYNGSVVYEMGAPAASESFNIGVLSGTYYYAMTFVTAGGEEYLGTVSNTISVDLNKINLDIPIGYSGTTSRKIYRTENGGATLKLVTEIADNTTLTYEDNTTDGSLGATIPSINNECKKPYFIESIGSKLIGSKYDLYPTQLDVSSTDVEVWDSSAYVDVSNIGNDNTPVCGMIADYNLLILGTGKNIFTVDVSQDTTQVTRTRANVGVLSGYSMARVPANSDFDGGVMFLSSLYDVRLFNGNFSAPVASSLDNLKTDNFSQAINQTLSPLARTRPNISAAFYDYKYILSFGDVSVIFDIRTQAWTKYKIETDSYSQYINCFGIISNSLFCGQKDSSIIEKMFSKKNYRGEDHVATFSTPQVLASDEFKYIKSIEIYYLTGDDVSIDINVALDGDVGNSITTNISLARGGFSPDYYSSNYYTVSNNGEDYFVLYVNKWARWLEFKVVSSAGIANIRGYAIRYQSGLQGAS